MGDGLDLFFVGGRGVFFDESFGGYDVGRPAGFEGVGEGFEGLFDGEEGEVEGAIGVDAVGIGVGGAGHVAIDGAVGVEGEEAEFAGFATGEVGAGEGEFSIRIGDGGGGAGIVIRAAGWVEVGDDGIDGDVGLDGAGDLEGWFFQR